MITQKPKIRKYTGPNRECDAWSPENAPYACSRSATHVVHFADGSKSYICMRHITRVIREEKEALWKWNGE